MKKIKAKNFTLKFSEDENELEISSNGSLEIKIIDRNNIIVKQKKLIIK